jgi:hypothetical protein
MQGYIDQNFWTRIECERIVRRYFIAYNKALDGIASFWCPMGRILTSVRNAMILYSRVNASITIQTDFKYN